MFAHRQRSECHRAITRIAPAMWGNLYADEKEAHGTYHLIQTLMGTYTAGMAGVTYMSISDPFLLPPPISLYAPWDAAPPRGRHEAAGSFSMLARIFPDTSSFELEAEIVPDPPLSTISPLPDP